MEWDILVFCLVNAHRNLAILVFLISLIL